MNRGTQINSHKQNQQGQDEQPTRQTLAHSDRGRTLDDFEMPSNKMSGKSSGQPKGDDLLGRRDCPA